MPTYGTPGNLYGSAQYSLSFEYDIDANHSGTVTITFPTPLDPDPENDHTTVDSLISAISASTDWTFVAGGRGWSGNQSITP